MEAASIVEKDNRLLVSGELNFATVMDLWNKSLPLFTRQSQLTIDLSQVTTSNSAGLALLIEWLKLAKNEKKTLKFVNIPQQLQTLADVAGVELI